MMILLILLLIYYFKYKRVSFIIKNNKFIKIFKIKQKDDNLRFKLCIDDSSER
jgi:hypothetical protein